MNIRSLGRALILSTFTPPREREFILWRDRWRISMMLFGVLDNDVAYIEDAITRKAYQLPVSFISYVEEKCERVSWMARSGDNVNQLKAWVDNL